MSRAYLQCLYMNEHSMGNKQEQLEVHAQLQSNDPTGITEIHLDSPHDWSAATDGHKRSGKNGWKAKRKRVALHAKG